MNWLFLSFTYRQVNAGISKIILRTTQKKLYLEGKKKNQKIRGYSIFSLHACISKRRMQFSAVYPWSQSA